MYFFPTAIKLEREGVKVKGFAASLREDVINMRIIIGLVTANWVYL